MSGPGEYRPDRTEGMTRIEDLPKPNLSFRSRNYRRRPCPRTAAVASCPSRRPPSANTFPPAAARLSKSSFRKSTGQKRCCWSRRPPEDRFQGSVSRVLAAWTSGPAMVFGE